MIKFTGGYNNWWTVTIDLHKSPAHSVFDISFNHESVQLMSFQHAADHTAKMIAQNYNNLYLAMSGGLDSSFIAEVLFRNHIPFTPIIAKILSNDNINHDHFHAMYWCEQHNIKPVVVTYVQDDPRLIKQCFKLIDKTKNYGPGAIVLLDLLEQVEQSNGHIIVGDPLIPRAAEGHEYYNPIGTNFDTGWIAYVCEMFSDNGSHPGGFFFYTPELALSFAKEIDTQSNESVAKTKLYNVPYRPKTFVIDYGLTRKTLDNIFYLNNSEKYSLIDDKVWTKEEFLTQLLK